MNLYRIIIALVLLPNYVFTGTHGPRLVWTQIGTDGHSVVNSVVVVPDCVNNCGGTALADTPVSDTSTTHNFTSLTYSYPSQTLYIFDEASKTILKNVVGSNTLQRVFDLTSSQVNGLALDWISDNLYYTDAVFNAIILVSLKSEVTRHKMLVSHNVATPYGIAVHPKAGLLFWTEHGFKPNIKRSNLDGSSVMAIASSNIREPMGITVDYTDDVIYWVDRTLAVIEKTSVTGQNRETWNLDPGSRPCGIAMLSSVIAITDQQTNDVIFMDKNNQQLEKMAMTAFQIYDIVSYTNSSQPIITDPCRSLPCNGGICVGNGEGNNATCVCPEQKTLQRYNNTCVDKLAPPQYIYSVGSRVCAHHVLQAEADAVVHSGDTCFISSSNVTALAMHVQTHRLFYYEQTQQTIYQYNISTGQQRQVVTGVASVGGLAVDWLAMNLYWTETAQKSISLWSMTGMTKSEVVKTTGRPEGITLHPAKGLMFWTQSTDNTGIFKAEMNGRNTEILVQSSSTRYGQMNIDLHTERVYWVDITNRGIYSCKLDGTDNKAELASLSFRGVAVYKSYLAWTESGIQSAGVYWSHKVDRDLLGSVEQSGTTQAYDVIVYDSSAQPRVNQTGYNNQWLSWSSWGTCSKTCSGGEQSRQRQCNGTCSTGQNSQVTECNTQSCQIYCHIEWYPWDTCVGSCNNATQKRTRICKINGTSLVTITQNRTCVPQTCNVDSSTEDMSQLLTTTSRAPTIRCSFYLPPKHASLATSCSGDMGATCEYRCNHGYYVASGTTKRMCTHSGWSGSELICLPIKCPAIPNPINGQVSCTDKGNFMSVCTSSCAEGYYLLGGDTRSQCQGNQSWSGNPVTCNVLPCEKFETPEGVNLLGCNADQTNKDVSCFTACKVGYKNIGGSSTRICQTDGQWSGASLQCKGLEPNVEETDGLPLGAIIGIVVGVLVVFAVIITGLAIYIIRRRNGNKPPNHYETPTPAVTPVTKGYARYEPPTADTMGYEKPVGMVKPSARVAERDCEQDTEGYVKPQPAHEYEKLGPGLTGCHSGHTPDSAQRNTYTNPAFDDKEHVYDEIPADQVKA